MDYQKMIDEFYDANVLGVTARYLYTQVAGGMLPLEVAKDRYSKVVDSYSDITENAKSDSNYIKMFENLFSESEKHRETALKFLGLK